MLFAVTFSVLPRLQVGNPAAIKAPGRPEELACHLGNCQTLQTVAKETRCIRMFILLDLVGVGRNTIGIFHDFSVSVSPCCLSLFVSTAFAFWEPNAGQRRHRKFLLKRFTCSESIESETPPADDIGPHLVVVQFLWLYGPLETGSQFRRLEHLRKSEIPPDGIRESQLGAGASVFVTPL